MPLTHDGNSSQINISIGEGVEQNEHVLLPAPEPEKQIIALLDALNDGIFALDAQWRCTYMNQTAEALVGKTRKELIGKNVWEVFADATSLPFYTEMHKAVQENKPGRFEVFYPPLGKWFDTRVFPSSEGITVIAQDITERRVTEEHRQDLLHQVEAEQARLQEVFNQMPGGVIIAEAPSGKILMGNQQVEDILGHSVLPSATFHDYGEWTGFHLDSGESVKGEEWPLARAIATGEVIKGEDYRYLRGDGTYCIIRINAAPICDAKDNIIAGVVTIFDVTEQRELEQRKDDFISIASHELKTPITTIKALTQLLKRKLQRQGLTEPVASLTKIETNVDKLTRLANDLLDVSKIQAGRLDYAEKSVNMNVLIRDVVETAQQITTTHTISLHGTLQKSMNGDADRLAQVFMNLLTNAIKYSPQANQVDVLLAEDEDKLLISVRDYGVGMSKDEQSKIFDRFYRIDDEKHRAIPGLGMGLYIACEIVERHGGDIIVTSEEGKGTTFVVSLPFGTHVKA